MRVYVAFDKGGYDDEVVCYAGVSLEQAVASRPKYRIEVWVDGQYVEQLSPEGEVLPSWHL